MESQKISELKDAVMELTKSIDKAFEKGFIKGLQSSRMIPFSKQLPNEKQEVLLWSNENSYHPSVFNSAGMSEDKTEYIIVEEYAYDEETNIFADIDCFYSHWMPKPEILD